MPPAPPASDLTEHLGYWLRLVSNRVSSSFARLLATEDVTVAEWVLMRVLLGGEGLPPSKLAAIMGMTRGAISKLAEKLLEKGLIERTASPDDARAHTLALTSKAKRLVPRLAALADENDRSIFGVLEPNERKVLRQLMEKLAARHGIGEMPIA